MRDIQINHVVPDGPEPYLSIPGPLSVALRVSQLFSGSKVFTASQNFSITAVDERIKNVEIIVSKKYQYKQRLATSFSPKLCIKSLFLQQKSLLHFHYSRSFTSMILCLIITIRRDLPLLLHTHGSVKADTGLAKWIYDFIVTRTLFRRATYIIALQENEKSHLLALGANAGKIVVIANMVQPLSFEENLNLQSGNNSTHQILFVGHLRPSKQVIRFFEIASQNQFSHCKFLIAGPDGGDLAVLLKKIRDSKSENIEYIGSLNWIELSEAYQSSDVILSTALDAPFDLSFLDGIARGCLGVASRSHNNWEGFQKAGVLIAPDTSVKNLTIALSLALDRIRSRAATKIQNSQQILESYGEEAIFPLWQEIYFETHRL